VTAKTVGDDFRLNGRRRAQGPLGIAEEVALYHAWTKAKAAVGSKKKYPGVAGVHVGIKKWPEDRESAQTPWRK